QHLVAALDLRLAALLPAGSSTFAHHAPAPLAPLELYGLLARLRGDAALPPDAALRRYELAFAEGTLYLEPAPGGGEDVLGPALDLLDVVEALAAARDEASHDPLTGLLNRRSLAHSLGSLIEQGKRYSTTFTLALMDLDHFKWFNDTFGHAEGDLL